MARYENEPCCGCGGVLLPQTEDVVVCPDCGAPMHRHCWQARGACPLSDQHSADFHWVPTISPQEPAEDAAKPASSPQVCPRCGESCEADARYCESCGTEFDEFSQSLRSRMAQDQQRREEYMKENFPAYTVNGRTVSMGDEVAGQPLEEVALQLRGSRRSVTHYLEYFERGGPLGWNWAAFFLGFFGPYWFFFRKLYKPALVFAGIWLAALLAFAPQQSRMAEEFNNRAVPYALQVQQALQEGDEAAFQSHMDEMSQATRAVVRQYRWLLIAVVAQSLGTAVAAALLADPLLKKKILRNIEVAREEAVGGPGQRFGRHQMLIRMGGVSLFAPLAYFWVTYFLPGWIVQIVTWIMG